VETTFAVRAAPTFLLEGEENFLGFAINHFARNADASRAARHPGNPTKMSCRLRAGLNRRDTRLDQENARTSSCALGNANRFRRLLDEASGERAGHFTERVPDRLLGIIVLVRQLRAFARNRRDDDGLVISERERLQDLDVVEVVPIFVFTRRGGSATGESGIMKKGGAEDDRADDGVCFVNWPDTLKKCAGGV
jgi:hypothetical protein